MNQVSVQNASDSELLRRYEEGRDEMSFAEIVRRHGPMVWRVARRVLGNDHDADEAFQSTFCTLATASNQLRDKNYVASWLHAVTRNSAAEIARSHKKWDRRAKRMSNKLDAQDSRDDATDPAVCAENRELERVLDEELAQLSRKVKRALVLCDLEGLTHAQAAKKLGLPASTVSAQVTNGRRKLRERLIQRGISLPAIGIAGYLAMERRATAELASEAIEMITTQSTLFATGKAAAEIGMSETVFQTATKVISTMTKAKIATYCLAAVFLIGSLTVTGIGISLATAGTVILDDFDDGAYADVWTISPISPGTLNAASGDMIIGRDETSIAGMDVFADALGVHLYNVSARTQVKVTETGGSSLIAVRNQNSDNAEAYGIGVGHIPNLGGSVVFFFRSDSLLDQRYFRPVGGGFAVLPYDVRQEDTIIQIDVMDEELRGWFWRPGGPVPSEPQFVVFDDVHTEPGAIRIISSNRGEPGAPGTSQSIFRYVHISDEHIPLSVPGDVNSDGTLSVADAEAVSLGLQANDISFDLNSDGKLGVDDLVIWVTDLANTYFGDANLDGEFNSGDLVAVFQAGKFETGLHAGWSDGDWNADGVFNSSDFVAAFKDGGFEQGPRAALVSVPEPALGNICIVFLLGVLAYRRIQ